MAYVIDVDTGGTFSDAFLADEKGRAAAAKTSSTPPDFAREFLTARGHVGSIAIMNLEGRHAGVGSDQVQHMARTNKQATQITPSDELTFRRWSVTR